MVIAAAPSTAERELNEAVDLCTAKGRLRKSAVGWSRHPLHRSNVSSHWPRKKRWNYWAVTSDRYLFSATVANLDYLGVVFVYFLDFESQRFIEKTVTVPFGSACDLPETVEGDIRFRNDRMKVALLDTPGGGTSIRARAGRFGGEPLLANIAVTRPAGHETLNVVIPWSRDRFQFTSKQNTLPASGTVRIGDREYEFEAGKSFACLDHGRGIWPTNCFWNWGAASGLQGGRTVGLNLGGGWTDGTGMTENGICVDGRLTKIGDDLDFHYDPSDYLRPWTVSTRGSQRVDLRLGALLRARREDRPQAV